MQTRKAAGLASKGKRVSTRHFSFDVIVVNWPTFKAQFDVEA